MGKSQETRIKVRRKTTTVMTCKCNHSFQDKVYGLFKRLHNFCAGEGKDWRCTVCGNEVRL